MATPIARFVIDKNNERGEISLSLADGKQRLKDFALKDGVEGELISEIFNKDGDNAKVFAQDGVSEVEDARVPECLVVGRYLKVANVSYLLQSDQAAAPNPVGDPVPILKFDVSHAQIPTLEDELAKIFATFRLQNKLYDKYPLLKKEKKLPLATVDKVDTLITDVMFGSFYFYPPLHPDVLDSLKKFMASSSGGTNPEQEAKLIAIHQLTRFGKTKLCYSLGFERFVVVLRYQSLKSHLPFLDYLKNTSTIFHDHVKVDKHRELQELGILAVRNQQLVSIWLCCYIVILRLLNDKDAFTNLTPIEQKEVFMRLTASGLAVGPIRDLFQSQLQKFDQNKSFTSEMIQYAKQNLMVFVVDDFLGSAEKEHMHIFPHVLEVDNSPAKVGVRQSQEYGGTLVGRPTSLFYAVLTTSETFARNGVPVLFTSTKFRAMRAMLDAEANPDGPSRARLRMQSWNGMAGGTQSMDTTLGKRFLYEHLELPQGGSQYTAKDLTDALSLFSGRNGFFFDGFFNTKVLPLIRSCSTPEELFDRIVDELRGDALTDLRGDVRGYITKFAGRSGDELDRGTIRRLYYFLIMHNGCTQFSEQDYDAINAGFAYLVKYDDKKLAARMFAEPIVKEVFQTCAQLLLPELKAASPWDISVDRDPIYAEIDNYYASDVGLAAESLVMSTCGVQKSSIAAYVKFAPISVCGTALELATSEIDFFLNPRAGQQMRSAYGRVDIVTPLVFISDETPFNNYKLIPAASQVRNLNKHITPHMFYNGPTDGALTTLDPRTFYPKNPSDRKKFVDACSDNRYEIYIRIIVSVLGFNDTVRKAVISYNQSDYGIKQPIILFTPNVSHFGKYANVLTGGTQPAGSHQSQVKWEDISAFTIPQCFSDNVVSQPVLEQRTSDSFLEFRQSSEPPLKKRKTDDHTPPPTRKNL